MEPNRTYTVIIGTEEILLENIHTIGTQEEQEAFAPPHHHRNMPICHQQHHLQRYFLEDPIAAQDYKV